MVPNALAALCTPLKRRVIESTLVLSKKSVVRPQPWSVRRTVYVSLPVCAARSREAKNFRIGASDKTPDFSSEKCDFSPCAEGVNRFNTRKSHNN
jgi:hypothetical protein